MTFDLDKNKKNKYASPYFTNWTYLKNMTEFQMIPLKETAWVMEAINDALWILPITPMDAGHSVENFRYILEDKIKGL
jgi:hypothetical protein